MDGSTYKTIDPHQLWLSCERADWAANRQAFLAARSDLSELVLQLALKLRDPAQHNFITMLRWTQGDLLVHQTGESALAASQIFEKTLPPE